MRKKVKLAFEYLERDLNVVRPNDLTSIIGGIQRDSAGNIIFVATGSVNVSHPSGYGGTAGMIAGYILADDGTQIIAYKKASGDAGWDTDCHGVSFGDGEFWINDDQVNGLLSGDNYSAIPSGSYYPGDKVVYYDSNGNVVHSATITSTDGGSGTTVYGQGGLEVDNHYDSIENGFSPSGYSYYQVYRQGQFIG
ncbi:hypothetical protein AB3466_17815 [Sphingobacterium thalpophilum]|uniref:hypothetical protein n=1 Tax=Sphingobacterium thalpophilum TaxID=259 RepID=UPI0037DA05B5